MKVLIVDDDELDCEITKEYLGKVSDFEVMIAMNIDEGKAFLSKQFFDMIIVDHYIVADTGLNLLGSNEFTEHQRIHPASVVYLTMNFQRDIKMRIKRMGLLYFNKIHQNSNEFLDLIKSLVRKTNDTFQSD